MPKVQSFGFPTKASTTNPFVLKTSDAIVPNCFSDSVRNKSTCHDLKHKTSTPPGKPNSRNSVSPLASFSSKRQTGTNLQFINMLNRKRSDLAEVSDKESSDSCQTGNSGFGLRTPSVVARDCAMSQETADLSYRPVAIVHPTKQGGCETSVKQSALDSDTKRREVR